jgi:hypothetical protein
MTTTTNISTNDYLLLTPLYPDMFGLDDSDLTTMARIAENFRVGILMMDAGKEILMYAYAKSLEDMEFFVSSWDISGMLVQCQGVYDQVIQLEVPE